MCYSIAFSFVSAGNPSVNDDMKHILRSMEIISGAVPCTDASRRCMRQQLRSLQIWQGLPSIFLTLNPADTKHPFTFYFSTAPLSPWEPCSTDATLWAAMRQVNLLHMVAADPVAVTRAFHEHVRLFLCHLLGCSPDADALQPDAISCRGHGGIVGPIAAYYAVTEPQLRGSLHLHMLLHLYAFSTPAALVSKLEAALPAFSSRLLSWTASCLSTCLESVVGAWETRSTSSNLLANLQALPYSAQQRRHLEQQVDHSWDFDVAASQWFFADTAAAVIPQPPWSDPFGDIQVGRDSFLPWPRTYLSSSDHSSPSAWTYQLVYDLRHSIVQCCLHHCRPRSCYKGFLGRADAASVGYWHWHRLGTTADGETWQRCHGFPLSSTP